MQHLCLGGGACAPPLTAGWRMCATPIQVMGGQGDWLDESRGPCPLTPSDSPSSTRGLPGGVQCAGASEAAKRGLKSVKNLFLHNFPWKNVSRRVHIVPAKPGSQGAGRSSRERPSARGSPGPPRGQQGGLAHMRQLAKLVLTSSLRRLS